MCSLQIIIISKIQLGGSGWGGGGGGGVWVINVSSQLKI